MTSFGLPDNFCICLSLKKGGNVIAGFCILASLVSFLMLAIYFFTNPNEIAQEISDNNVEMVQKLNENKACEIFLAFPFVVN